MMPVEGEYSAATQESSARARAPGRASSRPRRVTPLACAFFWMASRSASCVSSAATISLPSADAARRARRSIVEELLAFDAAARLERALRVVDAGVDHLGVARAGMRADRILGLEDHHLAARRCASARATARPTTPAPITTASSCSTQKPPSKTKAATPATSGHRGHRPRGAIERGAQRGADEGAGGEADGADEGRGGAGGRGEGRHRRGGGIRHHQRRTEKIEHERRRPPRASGPRLAMRGPPPMCPPPA